MTMIRKGHATASESSRMEALEEKLRNRKITSDEQLELALLNIEPGHDGFRAIEVLREIPAESPQFNLARLWIAYCDLYELMDEDALWECILLCDDLIGREASPRLRAAAFFLKASALRELDRSEAPIEDLLESVRLEPAWVSNRQFLAKLYHEQGHRLAAEEQLRKAIEVSRSQTLSVDMADQFFERLIAAQGLPSMKKTLQDQLQDVRGGVTW
jgi:tetratricopeptide (TPR) repeat protein